MESTITSLMLLLTMISSSCPSRCSSESKVISVYTWTLEARASRVLEDGVAESRYLAISTSLCVGKVLCACVWVGWGCKYTNGSNALENMYKQLFTVCQLSPSDNRHKSKPRLLCMPNLSALNAPSVSMYATWLSGWDDAVTALTVIQN